MKVINLKDLYDYLSSDQEIEISDDIYELLEMFRKSEEAYNCKVRYHNAYYSLDRDDGIENDAIKKVLTPDEILLEQETQKILIDAIFALPEKQAMRIYAYYYLDMSLQEIAEAEAVDRSSVSKSILRGLKNLKKMIPILHIFKDFSHGI